MKRILLIIIFCLIPTLVFAGSAILAWDPPTTNVDGSPITNLAGYKIYYGTVMGGPYLNIKDVPGAVITTTTVTNLASGDWYFVATAYKSGGLESGYSNEVKKNVAEVQPNAPTNLR